MKPTFDKRFKDDKSSAEINKLLNNFNNSIFKSNNKKAKININSITFIRILFDDKPDIIYTHSPLFYPIEFMFHWRSHFIVDRIFCLLII